MSVKITVNNRVVVESPYNPKFPAEAKKLGGRWDGDRKAWTFDVRDEERVRDLCLGIYGEDGREHDKVTVRFAVPAGDLGAQTYWRFGRQIAHRPGRDAEVRLGEAVVLLEGKFRSSGGSAKYPLLVDHRTDAVLVFEARDVPRPAVEADKGPYEIVDETPAENATVTVTGEALALLRQLQAEGATAEEVVAAALAVYAESQK